MKQDDTKRIPGFTAEASLYQTNKLYRLAKSGTASNNMLSEATYLPMALKRNGVDGDGGGSGSGFGRVIPQQGARAWCLAQARNCILELCFTPLPIANCAEQAKCLDWLELCWYNQI